MKLRELVEDVHYFIRDFSYIANQAPLQLYASAITFAPEASKVKSSFKDCMPQWLVLPPKVADVWGMDSLILEGHLGFTDGLSFSPCGTYLATCAKRDGALRVWHSSTGDSTLDIPRPGRMFPVTVSFSHDTKYLAAAYLGSHYSQEEVSLSAIIYDMVTGNAIDTYVWTTPKRSGLLDARLVFAHESCNALFVAVANGGFLEVWHKKIDSRTFEKAWGVQTGIREREHFTISASSSLVSCFSLDDRSITCRRLESGVHVSTHRIDVGAENHFGNFLDCRGSDLIYRTLGKKLPTDDGEHWYGRPIVQKLNTQTGQVDFIAYTEKIWRPEAISLKIGAIAYTKHYTGVVYMIDLLQCPKTDRLTSYEGSSVTHVSVSQNGEMVLRASHGHVELQDVLGNIVFRSSKVDFRAEGHSAYVSGDGSVVVAHVVDGTYVWLVKSGRELRLRETYSWLCSPAVSRSGKLMAFYVLAPPKPSDGNMTNGHMQAGMADQILLWDLEHGQEIEVAHRGYMPSYFRAWMLFSEDDKTLHTDAGDLDLGTGEWKADNFQFPDEHTRSISDDSSWLRLNGEDMLWLPESHRPEKDCGEYFECFGKNTIAYSCQDGSVVVMQCVDP